MNESEFHDIAEQTLEAIQDAIDNSDADIDYEEAGGVLTLEFANGSKIIFSKQPPVKQLWVAAKSGGFHFDYNQGAGHWMCDSGANETLDVMLNNLCKEQGEVGVEFSFS